MLRFTTALCGGGAHSGHFGDKHGAVGIGELMHLARHAVLGRSEGRQKPTIPRIEGRDTFPLARRCRSGEQR